MADDFKALIEEQKKTNKLLKAESDTGKGAAATEDKREALQREQKKRPMM